MEPSESPPKPHYSGIFVRGFLTVFSVAPVLTAWLENAVDPQNFEPNLALDLEISDLINSKKGNAYGSTKSMSG